MKRAAIHLRPIGVRRLSLFAAFMAFFMMAVEPTYASGNLQAYVTIPNPQLTPESGDGQGVDGAIESTPSSLELDAIKTVDASAMALVSLAARQVDLARQPEGAKEIAKTLTTNTYQWSDAQFACLDQLWTKESHWNYKARNKSSGAHGIAQALPATKMEVVGTDWRTNPVTQITWGLKYIQERYETPCKAWSKFKRSRWY
jgi:hypothetical protein